jgi:2-keto-4-pentenoate hydratase/2-oxohepta-3-ene-1,7-dioic acid hydratase in catechol pathway
MADAIAWLSGAMTLDPGDLVAIALRDEGDTSWQDSLPWKSGDRVEVDIDRLGVLVNPVR